MNINKRNFIVALTEYVNDIVECSIELDRHNNDELAHRTNDTTGLRTLYGMNVDSARKRLNDFLENSLHTEDEVITIIKPQKRDNKVLLNPNEFSSREYSRLVDKVLGY